MLTDAGVAAPVVTAEALHAALLAADSATAVLERLCGGPIRIRRCAAMFATPLSPALAGPPALHRRVELVFGDTILSNADLWYRPDLLPAAMARAIADTDTPFGRVVRGLGLRRRTLASRIGVPGDAACLEHRAVLVTPAGETLAEVFERYSWALVGSSGTSTTVGLTAVGSTTV